MGAMVENVTQKALWLCRGRWEISLHAVSSLTGRERLTGLCPPPLLRQKLAPPLIVTMLRSTLHADVVLFDRWVRGFWRSGEKRVG